MDFKKDSSFVSKISLILCKIASYNWNFIFEIDILPEIWGVILDAVSLIIPRRGTYKCACKFVC